MRIRFRYLACAPVAAAIIGAPTAVADDTDPTSTSLGGPYPVPYDEGNR